MHTGARRFFAIPMLAGITYALIWLAIGALILSLLLQFTSMKESSLTSMAYIIHGASSLFGGFAAGKRSENKGWSRGGLLGILYGLIVILISFLASDISLSLHSFLLLLTVVVAGAFGGMIGVNLRK